MTDTKKEQTSPDQLLESFKGGSLKSIIVFTVVIHAVILVGASVPFIIAKVSGGDAGKLDEKERIDAAMREATTSLREIAEKHQLKPQDLSDRLAGGAPRSAATPAPVAPAASEPTEPEAPKSAIEKELETKEAGPEIPDLGNEKEDLFK